MSTDVYKVQRNALNKLDMKMKHNLFFISLWVQSLEAMVASIWYHSCHCFVCWYTFDIPANDIHGLVQERRNSISNALGFFLHQPIDTLTNVEHVSSFLDFSLHNTGQVRIISKALN